jgi:hypothetical protein
MKLKYGILMAALAASLFGVPAFAASNASSDSTATGSGTANANNTANITNTANVGTSSSTSNSGSYAGSTANGGKGIGIGTGGTGGNASGSSTVNFSYVDPPAAPDPAVQTERIVTTGAAIAPSMYNNNSCALSASAAAGFMGGAFALGFDRVDKGCDWRAFAALLGHFAEINSIAAAHAPDPQTRALAEQASITYSQWANNYLCMQNPDLAAAVPPGSNLCHTVATQQGMQVVPAPVSSAQPMQPVRVAVYSPPSVAVDVPPAKPLMPHVYGTYEAVPASYRNGPISGYSGPLDGDD